MLTQLNVSVWNSVCLIHISVISPASRFWKDEPSLSLKRQHVFCVQCRLRAEKQLKKRRRAERDEKRRERGDASVTEWPERFKPSHRPQFMISELKPCRHTQEVRKQWVMRASCSWLPQGSSSGEGWWTYTAQPFLTERESLSSTFTNHTGAVALCKIRRTQTFIQL